MAARDLDECGRPPEDDDLVVHLVPMRRRHLRAVLRIEAQAYPRPWSLGLFMSELALRSSRSYHVAKVGGSVVGYAGMMLAPDEAHVTTIAVDPLWHRHKIATRLFLNMARVAQAHRATALTLEVRVSNHGAQDLYRKFGLRPVGIRRNYYTETNEDALIMTTDEVATPAYEERLATIAAGIPGTTVLDGGGR